MRGISLITIHIIFAACFSCTRLVTVPDKDADQDTVDVVDTSEDTGAPETNEDSADDLDIEEETICVGPEDDCDDDGWADLGGDCCDTNPEVYPLQDQWFSVPYACPEENWDYDCDGEVEFEQADYMEGIDAVLPEGIQKGCIGFNMSECGDMEGWVGGSRPSCGAIAEYVRCYWYSNSYVSECHARDPSWSGMMRCR